MVKELVFCNPDFENAVRDKLLIKDYPIYESDALKVIDLDLSLFTFDDRDCNTLNKFKNLECLDINFGFEDISFISMFKNLRELSFEYYYDFNFMYLSELKYLRELFVSGGDYSGAKFVNLEEISDISKLESLGLHEFGYVDLRPLNKMQQLKNFYCGYADKVDNYDSIGSLVNLEKLTLIDLQMDSIEFLKSLPNKMNISLCGMNFTKEIDVSVFNRFSEKDISEMTINSERVFFDGDYIWKVCDTNSNDKLIKDRKGSYVVRLFDFLKKKGATNKIKQNNRGLLSPAKAFEMFGANGTLFWNAFVEGQNLAVKTFDAFKTFKSQLDNNYSTIDFDRFLSNIEIGDKSYEIRVKHGIYLYMLNLDKDCYVTFDGLNDATLLPSSELERILFNLSAFELEYCDKLSEYIRENIHSLVEKTDKKRFGTEKSRRLLPINSLELYQYHKKISEEYPYESDDDNKLRQCLIMPCIVEKNDIDNPMIISETSAITAFVMDYLCYATMWLPTFDFVRFVEYKNDNGRSVEDALRENFGQEAVEFIKKVVSDLNGSMFRTSVYSGMLLQ